VINQQIPNEARTLLRNGNYEVVGEEILIGSYTFPFDLPHMLEIFDVLGPQEGGGKEQFASGIRVLLEFCGHAAERVVGLLKAMPPEEREQYRESIKSLLNLIDDIQNQF
jgi:hypothetical protein